MVHLEARVLVRLQANPDSITSPSRRLRASIARPKKKEKKKKRRQPNIDPVTILGAANPISPSFIVATKGAGLPAETCPFPESHSHPWFGVNAGH